MSPLLVCGRCGAPLATLAEAVRHCPTGYPEDAWYVSHEWASMNPEEHCSRMALPDWAESGRSRPRP